MIKKIIHISDVHIRTYQYHDMYRKIMKDFISDIKGKLIGVEHDEIRIVITGDLFHQKIHISNEQVLLSSWFLGELIKIGKVVIIPGNHDFLENNTDRVDSISPIVDLINSPEISYYKDSGVYSDENIRWVVYSLYQHNVRPDFEKKDDGYYVGLFHGVIQGMSTDLGFKFDDGYDKLNFNGLDLLLAGDIHLRQRFRLPGGGDAVMIGSMIQQNFSESVKHHGYGMFDMETKKYTFHDIENDRPFLHFKINDINDITSDGEVLLNDK